MIVKTNLESTIILILLCTFIDVILENTFYVFNVFLEQTHKCSEGLFTLIVSVRHLFWCLEGIHRFQLHTFTPSIIAKISNVSVKIQWVPNLFQAAMLILGVNRLIRPFTVKLREELMKYTWMWSWRCQSSTKMDYIKKTGQKWRASWIYNKSVLIRIL